MATLRNVIRTTLEGNAGLTALLTGGIYDASELPREGLTPTNTAAAFDANGRLKPTAILRWRGAAPTETEPIGEERRFVEIYVYQDQGYEVIDSAIALIKPLLHRQEFSADGLRFVSLRWAGDLGEMVADELQSASMNRSRYEVVVLRS